MYRLVFYVLSSFFVCAMILSLLGLLPFTPLSLILSLLAILLISYAVNFTFSYIYKASTNVESVYITALIMFFLITPPLKGGDYSQFLFLVFWASIFAMGSKYILAIGRKHIFNPAAVAMVLLAFILNLSANWWIGTPAMLPFVLLGGALMARKICRLDLVLSFMISALASISFFAFLDGSTFSGIFHTLILTLTNSAFFFFAFIMLTEPLTGPTTKWPRIAFGILVGFLFSPLLHIGPYYSTPELALVIGNIFAYLAGPKEKLFLKLKERIKAGADTYDFIFQKDKKFNFKPGQYMEWTLSHTHSDVRGVRRYFTLASSPTEPDIRLGVKFYDRPSSFKKALLALGVGEEIIASQKSGDFVLPKNIDTELVFIAGGIGITPFRSMVQYLLDKKEKRKITLLYSNKRVSDIAYKEIFDRAEKELGIKTLYVITDELPDETIADSRTYNGFINAEVLQKEVPEYMDKIFYISGPHSMVDAFEKTLKSIGVPRKNIKTDFFPGFA